MAINKDLIQSRVNVFWEKSRGSWHSFDAVEFHHQNAKDCFEAFKVYETNVEQAEADFRQAMQNGVTPSDFLEEKIRKNSEKDIAFWDSLYRVIAYCDTRGYRSPKWGENKIWGFTKAGVYQHYWIYNLLAYKKANCESEQIKSLHVKRAIQYLENPKEYCTILSNNHRILIAKNLFQKDETANFEQDMRDFFHKYGAPIFQEERNRMWAYSSFFYENKELWFTPNNQLKYSLKSFSIKKFIGIKDVEIKNLKPENRWIFLTGENGFGKTSVLQALALGLRGVESFTFNLEKENPDCRIEITLNNSTKSTIKKAIKKRVLAYGSSRLMLLGKDHAVSPKSPVQSLFQNNVALSNIEEKFADWHIKRNENDLLRERYEQAQEAFSMLLPRLQIVPNEETNEITYIELPNDENSEEAQSTGYAPVQFHQLAAGYKTILVVVGDMLIRLYEEQKDVTLTSDLSGIVLIDELELHLHPKWQKALPSLLSEIFPQVQFIVSTHSPIPLLGAPENSVFLKVNRTKEEGITLQRLEDAEEDISNWLPNIILSSPLFGLTEIYPTSHKKEERIRTEDSYDEKVESDERRKRIDEFFSSPENREKVRNLFKK